MTPQSSTNLGDPGLDSLLVNPDQTGQRWRPGPESADATRGRLAPSAPFSLGTFARIRIMFWTWLQVGWPTASSSHDSILTVTDV